MTFDTQQIVVGAFGGSVSVPSAPAVRSQGGEPGTARYVSIPGWTTRSFELGETTRLNKAHWQNARDFDINAWLVDKLSTIRGRATYECRNNGMLAGLPNSLADDVVGPDGPMLEVQSDDPEYNRALEQAFRTWFAAPTFRRNMSGTALLKLWVRNLPKCGEFVSTIGTDETADGPIKMRLQPIHPRRLASPDGNSLLGIEVDQFERPRRYYIRRRQFIGGAMTDGYSATYDPYSPDDIIHEFITDEEGQLRGFPWLTPSLPAAADLRDYDADVLESARRAAQNNGVMYTDSPDAPVYTAPETLVVEPGEIPMLPPQWKMKDFPATQPAAQYESYRSERQREFGRPMNMPLLMVRLDSSKHNYSSARLDTQSYSRMTTGIQCWLSGTPKSYGTLNRLVDLVAAEARFLIPVLRRRPANVSYAWTWPARPHVDVAKEADGEAVGLETRMLGPIMALHARGVTLEQHIAELQRYVKALTDAGLPLPAWLSGGGQASTQDSRNARAQRDMVEQQRQQQQDEQQQTNDKQEVASVDE